MKAVLDFISERDEMKMLVELHKGFRHHRCKPEVKRSKCNMPAKE